MTEIFFRDYISVTCVRSMASDEAITQAARVSTQGSEAYQEGESAGLINFLMKGRHGSPFEHAMFTWLIEGPIFMWREFMRHRIASYNEESGRYKTLEPIFYVPGYDRKLVQVGKAGAYTFESGTQEQLQLSRVGHMTVATVAYENYEKQLEAGIAREVARMSLPLNIFSSAFVSMNPRALMNFLSLRTKSEDSMFPSFPQREIEMAAEQMEEDFQLQMPLTYEAFVKNGRVAP